MSVSNFDKWFSQQVEAGLVDIKLAITAGKGVTNEAIKDEILAAEAAISSGFFREPPKARSATPADIMAIIKNSTIQATA